jgi:hypothetical protein
VTDLTGAALACGFHADVVGPLLARELPGLAYAAARLGSGSDVLELDDVTSRDHDWGCRLTLLVDEVDRAVVPRVDTLLSESLPDRYRSMPVRFATTWSPTVSHQVHVTTVRDHAYSWLGVDPLDGLSTVDWLTVTGHAVLETVAGPVFVDRTRELSRLRDALRWYPPDVERYVLAAGWQRLAQQLPMHGRTAQRGDEVGSRLLAASAVGDLMRLGFLLARQWPPYRKWFGTMFARLPAADALAPLLNRAVTATAWQTREDALAAAAEVLLVRQRSGGLPTPASGVGPFFDRPYRTIAAAVAQTLLTGVTDPQVLRLTAGIGTVEQWVDNFDVLAAAQRRAAVAATYRAWLAVSEPGAAGQLPNV